MINAQIQRGIKPGVSNPDFIITTQKRFTKNADIIVVVSKKVAKKATERNRIKRIIKEAIRSLGYQKMGLNIIVKRNIADLKSSQVKSRLVNLVLEYDKKNL